jgi:hypothetical protein
MKILIDECLPDELKGTLTGMGHECQTVRTAGYGSKKNGELLTLAEGRVPQVPILRLGVLTLSSEVCVPLAQPPSHCVTKLQNSRQPLPTPQLPRVSFE